MLKKTDNGTRTVQIDLGCGTRPRNPYGCDEVIGLDIRDLQISETVRVVACDLFTNDLPFGEAYADTITAYDFLEHVPRVLYHDRDTIFPFVKIMSEIHRVLKPGGIFYALTPVYPKDSAFVDPTHVNFIARDTHKYFTEPDCGARMYGFEGSFSRVRARVVNFATVEGDRPAWKTRMLNLLDTVRPVRKQHMEWVFTANK